MRTRGLLSIGIAIAIALSSGISLVGQAQDAVPARAVPQESTKKPDATDAHYREFDKWLSFFRARNAKQFVIDSVKGIDEASYVAIGGIEQWVTIKGQDRNNPVLLLVHGGPGDATNPWTYALFASWEEHFTVVQWDLRGAGRTLRKTGPGVAPTITLDRMTQDGIELTEYLRKHLGKDKVIVLGHSFGTIFALRMVRARPELFYAFVGTGQSGDNQKNYAAAYDALLSKAQALGNQEALQELRHVGPPPYSSGEGYQVQRKWANKFEGADHFLPETLGLALQAPGSSVQDITDWFDGQVLSADRLVPQVVPLTQKELVGFDFAVPIFVFQGAEDFTTPTALARQYLASIHAPSKTFVAIQGCGHFAMFMCSDQFLRELVMQVSPLARAR